MAGVNTNTRQVSVNNRVGGEAGSWTFDAQELIYDDAGVVRLISRRYGDGSVGNFKLMPRNKTAQSAMSFAQKFLVPFGISVAGAKLIEGRRAIDFLTKWMVFSWASGKLTDLVFDSIILDASAYYEITTGELVFEQPIILSKSQRG